MSNDEKTSQTNDTDADAPEADVVDSLRKRMRPFLVLFGSAAAVATFLLFAGFLSDFAVYQLAGLPRLDFSYTALVEAGAAVVVDTLSLLVASPARVITLLLLFVFLVALWAYRETPRLKHFARSIGIYQTVRLILFLYAAFLLAGQIGLIQRGLHQGDMKQQQIAKALDAAYQEADGGIPDPRARLRAIERIDYQITAFPFPNWAEKWLEGASHSDTQEWQEAAGLPLRLLPESRQAAAHVFGWLTISLLILLLSVVLLPGWFDWLQKNQPSSEERMPLDLASGLSKWWSHPALDEPVHYLIAPLTLVLCILSFALLPLSHGLLARSSLGNEAVMVMLDSNPTDQNKTGTLKCLDENSLEAMEAAVNAYRTALKHLIQNRPSEENQYKNAEIILREALSKLVNAAIAAECPLAVQTLWELSPSSSLNQTYPSLAAGFRAEMTRALLHYGVRLGTLLSYPRDAQPLTLIETLQARTANSGGQWALTSIERKSVREVVVLPNTLAIKIADYKRSMIQNPNSDAKKPLLGSQDAAALAATLELLKNRYLYVSHAGVAVTSLGGMAQANLNDRPDLSRQAIDLLTDIASSHESSIWPDKENDIRGAAITALHLTRSPYAAYKLAEELRKDKDKSCDGKLVAVHCIPETITAAGFLLSDLTAEARLLPPNKPNAVTATRDALTSYLLELSMNEKASDDHRSAACSSINNSGVRNIADAKLAANFFTTLQKMNPTHNSLALPVCINTMSMLHMESEEHRAFLRKLFFSKTPEQASAIAPYTQARHMALITLSELGLAGESDFLFRAYTESEAKLRDNLVSKRIDEADPSALASKLLDCVNTTWEKDEGRVRLCLQGMLKLKDSYDGDEGATQRILTLLHDHPASALKESACEVLRDFEKRGGLLARRLFKEAPGYCPQTRID